MYLALEKSRSDAEKPFCKVFSPWSGRLYYVNPQARKPQAQRDWLDLLQGRCTMGLSHESIFVRIAPFSLTSITVI